jgi:RNA polymerase sigma-70 factor, ECF subfamily
MSRAPAESLFIDAIEGGDLDLDRLAAAWLPHVYAWCHRLGGPGLDAEDAAHEVLITMCRSLRKVGSAEVFPTWLFATTRRTLANHRRRAWLRKWLPGPVKDSQSPSWSPLRTVEAAQAAQAVWSVLETLPAAQREVLVLCMLEERSATEVARLVDAPVGTVKSRLRLAKNAFRDGIVTKGLDVDLPVAEVVG